MTRHMEWAAYPTLGEGLRLLANAFDLRVRVDKSVTKRIDRYAADGEFDSEIFEALLEEAIRLPLDDMGAQELGELLVRHARRLRLEYLTLVTQVSADGLKRDELLPLLCERLFPSYLGSMLMDAYECGLAAPLPASIGRPLAAGDPRRVSPLLLTIVAFFGSCKELSPPDPLSAYTPKSDDDPDRKLLSTRRDWLAGHHVPDEASIRKLAQDAIKWASTRKEGIAFDEKRLVNALRIARAVEFAFSKVPDRERFLEGVVAETRRLEPPQDLGKAISQACRGTVDSDLSLLGLTAHNALSIAPSSEFEDMEAAMSALRAFDEACANSKNPWAVEYMLEWCKAMKAVREGDMNQALDHYDAAVRKSLYRSGPEAAKVLKEATWCANRQKKRTNLKRYLEVGNALGVWPRFLVGSNLSVESSTPLLKYIELEHVSHHLRAGP